MPPVNGIHFVSDSMCYSTLVEYIPLNLHTLFVLCFVVCGVGGLRDAFPHVFQWCCIGTAVSINCFDFKYSSVDRYYVIILSLHIAQNGKEQRSNLEITNIPRKLQLRGAPAGSVLVKDDRVCLELHDSLRGGTFWDTVNLCLLYNVKIVQNFHSQKYIWKCRLWNGVHLVSALMCEGAVDQCDLHLAPWTIYGCWPLNSHLLPSAGASWLSTWIV